MVELMVQQLAAVGIQAVAEPMEVEAYFQGLAAGGCKDLCRSSWLADPPTYDSFLYEGFHSSLIGTSNFGNFADPEFDRLVSLARSTTDDRTAADLYHKAESLVLDQVAVIPIAWFTSSLVYDRARYADVELSSVGYVRWEEITIVG